MRNKYGTAKAANSVDSIKMLLKEQKREMAELQSSVFLKEFKAERLNSKM